MALVVAARRYYSSDNKTGEPVKESDAEEQGQEDQETKTSPESEMLKKLQAKEQEVVDLTVRKIRIFLFLIAMNSSYKF
jgi:hypothetical protein